MRIKNHERENSLKVSDELKKDIQKKNDKEYLNLVSEINNVLLKSDSQHESEVNRRNANVFLQLLQGFVAKDGGKSILRISDIEKVLHRKIKFDQTEEFVKLELID